MQPDAFRLAMAALFLVAAIAAAPEGASAGPSLYTGSIQIRLNYHSVPSTTTVVPTYSIPFGASFSYPAVLQPPRRSRPWGPICALRRGRETCSS